MIKNAIKLFPVLMLGLLIVSCEKVERSEILGESIDFSDTMDSIPLQYGRLVSATSVGQHTNVLWFEQADQTIVGVTINRSRGAVAKEVIRIERR